jgi:hypothetical protein
VGGVSPLSCNAVETKQDKNLQRTQNRHHNRANTTTNSQSQYYIHQTPT